MAGVARALAGGRSKEAAEPERGPHDVGPLTRTREDSGGECAAGGYGGGGEEDNDSSDTRGKRSSPLSPRFKHCAHWKSRREATGQPRRVRCEWVDVLRVVVGRERRVGVRATGGAAGLACDEDEADDEDSEAHWRSAPDMARGWGWGPHEPKNESKDGGNRTHTDTRPS